MLRSENSIDGCSCLEAIPHKVAAIDEIKAEFKKLALTAGDHSGFDAVSDFR